MTRTKKMSMAIAAALAAAGWTTTGTTYGQINLSGTSYTETFDGLAAGTPNGLTLRTGANTSQQGTAVSYTATPAANTSWTDTSGAFKNFASATGLTSTATTAQQTAATDRAIGIRQTGTFGDPGAAFEFAVANTAGFKDFSLDIDLELLSHQTRATTWTIDYRVGSTGSFTQLDTFSDPGAFGTTTRNINLTSFTDLNNQNDFVTFRVVALFASTGTGSRDSFGIDNFKLNYTQIPSTAVYKTWDADGAAGSNPSDGNGTWDDATANWHASGAHSTWSDAAPDNAIFGSGSGTGSAAVTLATDRTAGSITFAANSPQYALSGNTLTLKGSAGVAISAQNSATIDSNVALDGTFQSVAVAAGSTLAINGQVSGGTLNKTTGGTLVLTNNGNTHARTRITGGTLEVSNDGQLGAAGAALLMAGGTLKTTAAITPSRSLEVQAESTVDTNGHDLTFGASQPLTGGSRLNKVGAGVLTLGGATPTFGGGVDVEGGAVRVNAVDSNGVSGIGTAAVNVFSGGVFHIDNVRIGFQSDGTTPGTDATSIVHNGGTLRGTGNAGISGGNQWANSGSLTLDVPAAADRFVAGNSVRNVTAGSSTANINVTGAGQVQLASGGTNSTTGGTQFSGAWTMNMDNETGVLSVGPILNGGFGETLNALGYQPPSSGGGSAIPYTGETRPITINSGTLAIGTDQRNHTTSNPLPAAMVSIRSPITLNGGKIASTGRRIVGAAPNQSATGELVTAQIHGSVSVTADSSVLLYDPVAGAAAGPRNLDFMTDPTAAAPGAGGAAVPNNFSWGAAQLGTVAHSGAGDPGRLRFMRNAGTVSVTPGASLNIAPNTVVQLLGTTNALSDGTNHVNVVNNGALEVSANIKDVGNVAGSGSVTVNGGATLNANHIRGASLNVDNGKAVIRPTGGTAAGVSKVAALTISDTGVLDLEDNKLITDKPLGTFSGGAYSGVHGDIARAYNFGTWDGPSGLTTSQDLANPTSGPLGGTTTIAITKASEVLFIGEADTALFAGQTVTGSSTIAMYTYAGDVNLDGLVDAADYGVIDNWIQFPGTDGYANGDFNYDGIIDAADYGIIDNSIQLQGAPFPGVNSSYASAEVASAAAGLSGVTAVPEPASLGVVALAAATAFGRRRRRLAK